MTAIFDVTFPFFSLVLVGWVAARRGWVPGNVTPALNAFVLYFALPCLLFHFASTTPVRQMFAPAIVAVWLVSGLLMVGLALLLARRRRTDWNNAAYGALVAAFPNTGFMGIPLLVDLLGQRAVAPVLPALAIDMVFTSSLCIAISRGDAPAGGARRALVLAMKGMVSNPLPWSIALGCALSASGVAVPTFIAKSLVLLSSAATPTALFALGAMLAGPARDKAPARVGEGPQVARVGEGPQVARVGDVPQVVALKLAVHPLVVGGACILLRRAGVALDAFSGTVLVLLAALPSASNVPMLAQRFEADAGRIARIVLWSTLAAFLTFTLACHFTLAGMPLG